MNGIPSDTFVGNSEQHPPPRKRRAWPFLLIGLALGLTAALIYSWILNPVQFYNTAPADLRADYQETWIRLVAAAYRQDGDLERALTRLRSLNDPQIGHTVARITEQRIQAGQSATQIRAMVALADALGSRTESMLIYLSTSEPTLFLSPTPQSPTWTPIPSPSSTPLPTATQTPLPTSTPSPTPTGTPTLRPTLTRQPSPTLPPPYRLQDQERLCQTGRATPLIEIFVESEQGAGIPGSEIWITWNEGVDRFVTGLKPEVGLGYADFQMQPDATYNVGVQDPQLLVAKGLAPEPCPSGENNDRYASWRLVIVAIDDALTPTPTPTPQPTPTPASTSAPTSTPNELIP